MVLIITTLDITILTTVVPFYYIKLKNREIDMEIVKFNASLKLGEDDYLMLDKFISDTFNLYQLTNSYLLSPPDSESYRYIDEELMKSIIENVSVAVLTNMSPVIYDKLAYIFNKEKIDEIVFQRVQVVVIQFTVDHNQSK